MSDLRIGSLCSGYGGLDMAVQQVLGGSIAWHCQWEPPNKDGKPDKWQFAARILAHHWPDVPNHGDLTAVDWSTVEPVDVLAMGFPCTDVSSAGLRAGIAEGTRSGVWFHCARAIEELRPDLVVIENVEGLLSARADRGVGSTDPDVEAAGDDALRALGCVLGDLADRGFDAEWCRVAASDAGAPHRRYRIFILAWAAADAASLRRREGWPESAGIVRRPDAALGGGAAPADTTGERHGNTWPEGDRWVSPASVSGLTPLWGPYGPAIHRWERVLGRPAPQPTEPGRTGQHRLSPAFVEFLMGLPLGHVTQVPPPPGMSPAGVRNAQLKALGNGVVLQQAAYALRLLLDRMNQEVAA